MSSTYKLVLFLALLMFGCTSAGDRAGTGDANATKPIKHTVEIAEMKFNPAILEVKKGDSIVFVNRDIVAHDVTEEKEKAWNSSTLSTGMSWILVADATVSYYCSIHPVMKGKINVK